MKTYNKPIAKVVELTVKESLSDVPFTFSKMAKIKTGTSNKTVSIYKNNSAGQA